MVRYAGRDFWATRRHYSVCQKLCTEAEAEHAGSGSVTLPRCPGTTAITALAAKAKVDSLKAYQVRSLSLLWMQSHTKGWAINFLHDKMRMQA